MSGLQPPSPTTFSQCLAWGKCRHLLIDPNYDAGSTWLSVEDDALGGSNTDIFVQLWVRQRQFHRFLNFLHRGSNIERAAPMTEAGLGRTCICVSRPPMSAYDSRGALSTFMTLTYDAWAN